MRVEKLFDIAQPLGRDEEIFAVLQDEGTAQPSSQVEADIVPQDAADDGERNDVGQGQVPEIRVEGGDDENGFSGNWQGRILSHDS